MDVSSVAGITSNVMSHGTGSSNSGNLLAQYLVELQTRHHPARDGACVQNPSNSYRRSPARPVSRGNPPGGGPPSVVEYRIHVLLGIPLRTEAYSQPQRCLHNAGAGRGADNQKLYETTVMHPWPFQNGASTMTPLVPGIPTAPQRTADLPRTQAVRETMSGVAPARSTMGAVHPPNEWLVCVQAAGGPPAGRVSGGVVAHRADSTAPWELEAQLDPSLWDYRAGRLYAALSGPSGQTASHTLRGLPANPASRAACT